MNKCKILFVCLKLLLAVLSGLSSIMYTVSIFLKVATSCPLCSLTDISAFLMWTKSFILLSLLSFIPSLHIFAVWNSSGVFRLLDSQIIYNRRFSEFQKSICKNLLSSAFQCSHMAAGDITSPIQAFLHCCLIIFPIQWINFPYRSNLGFCIHMIELLFIISRSSPVVRFFFSLVSLSFVLPYWLPCTCRYTPVKASFLFSLASLSLHFLNLAFTLILEDGFKKTEGKYLDNEKISSFP